MGLAYVLEKVGEELPTEVRYRVGWIEDVARQESPPRIIAVPASEAIESAKGSGGDGVRFPRRFLSRACTVDFHIWGVDMEQAEDLAERVWNAVQKLVAGSYRPAGARWVGDGVIAKGVVYVASVTFLVPISRREQLRQLGTLPITQELVTP
jgi:hypothetical protein